MAALVDKSMGALNEARKPMYPLFEKPQKPLQNLPDQNGASIQQTAPEENSLTNAPPDNFNTGEHKHTRYRATSPSLNSLQEPPNIGAVGPGDAELLEVDLNSERRKRRKTASPSAKESPGGGKSTPPLQQDAQISAVNSPTSTGREGLVAGNIGGEPQWNRLFIQPSRPLPTEIPSCTQMQEAPQTTREDMPHPVSTHEISDQLTQNQDGGTADSSKGTANSARDIAGQSESRPKRILRLNTKTGTIGSPPSKKKELQAEVIPKLTRTSRSKQLTSRIVIMSYGHDTKVPELGLKIDQILQGSATADQFTAKTSAASQKPKSRKVVGANPGAAPHPFFLGKAAAKPPVVHDGPPPSSEITGIPRPKGPAGQDPAAPKTMKKATHSNPFASEFSGFGGFGGSTAKLFKFPGAVEPAWPWKGMNHIRGYTEAPDHSQLPSAGFSDPLTKPKKSKYQAVEVLATENIINTLSTELCVAHTLKDIREINIDEYPQLPACLRVPARHFMAAPNLQERVRKELNARFPASNANREDSDSDNEIQGIFPRKPPAHPALTTIYNTLATSLSAFDQSQCETQAWIHKYSPKRATEVLQTGQEAMILKQWLQSLTVQSVETGVSDRSLSRASSVSRRAAPGKRKQKAKNLDGFVVSSGEEEEVDMDEISEPEDSASPSGSQGLLKKTVVRAGNAANKGSTRLTNAVVVSGPHGSGKTAAVYAVAKELGFEVFEINSGSRRSGKDILEKVGDMTHNHLVSSSQTQTHAEPVDEDAKRIEDALDSDLKSGRQGTMNSFFRPDESVKTKSKPKKSNTSIPKSDASKSSALPKAPPKQQKQSLILFEEVDILYEEDKQFWATVVSLIIQSKRPIIMTCTDESTVPFASLTLHAIIRFTPPPVDLATDYMLLVAANEGHILRRDAIKSLYESRRLDLRASLTELNFWCQFAVGDNKGGLEWLYPRWPPGTDVDDYGRTIRVISEGTYEAGMGWVSQDFLESSLSYLDIEEETLHEAWDGWHLDVGDWQKNLDIPAWASKMRYHSNGKGDDRTSLSMYGEFLDAMSAADLCSGGEFATDTEIILDASLPSLSPKAREDYVLSHELLEVAPAIRFDNTAADISLWMKSRARKYLQVDQHVHHGFEVPSELDRLPEARIIQLIRTQSCSPDPFLIRQDFSLAFDPIAEPEKTSLYSTGHLEASCFDRTLALITTDIAPYVRSIVAYDTRLQQDRTHLSNLMSEGGRRVKKMRTTRSAMSALEGGARSTTRRERYFGPGLNPHFVLKTGMQSWLDAAATIVETQASGEVNETENAADEMVEES